MSAPQSTRPSPSTQNRTAARFFACESSASSTRRPALSATATPSLPMISTALAMAGYLGEAGTGQDQIATSIGSQETVIIRHIRHIPALGIRRWEAPSVRGGCRAVGRHEIWEKHQRSNIKHHRSTIKKHKSNVSISQAQVQSTAS